jgi:hypothetical protein
MPSCRATTREYKYRRGVASRGREGTGANGEASGTDGEFVSGADTDTGIDRGLPRAPRRLKTLNAVKQVLLQEEDAMATPLSPGTMLNEAWELAMGGDDDATRDSHHEHRILDEDDEPTPLTLFRDAIDEDNDEEEEDAGFASAGNDGANERVGPGQADDVALDVMPNNDDSLVNDDSFADPALDISVEDTGHDADGAGTPQRVRAAPASSHVAMGALSPPSPLVAPSERHSFRLSRQASLQSHGSGSSQKSSSTPSRGWGEGGHSTPDTTRRMSKAEEVLKAATRHSSDDDVDELADSSDEERAGPSMASSSILGYAPNASVAEGVHRFTRFVQPLRLRGRRAFPARRWAVRLRVEATGTTAAPEGAVPPKADEGFQPIRVGSRDAEKTSRSVETKRELGARPAAAPLVERGHVGASRQGRG